MVCGAIIIIATHLDVFVWCYRWYSHTFKRVCLRCEIKPSCNIKNGRDAITHTKYTQLRTAQQYKVD